MMQAVMDYICCKRRYNPPIKENIVGMIEISGKGMLNISISSRIIQLIIIFFLGIPFAAAPVKNLRFMPPVTVSPWKEVLNADRFAPVCPQVSQYGYICSSVLR